MSPVPIVSVHFGPDLFLFLLTDSIFSGCIVAAECMYPPSRCRGNVTKCSEGALTL